MEQSTTPAAPVVFDVRSLWRRLAALSDRRRRRGKRYALPLVLLLIVLAKLSGEDRPIGIADWVRHRRVQLAQALGWSWLGPRTTTATGGWWRGR